MTKKLLSILLVAFLSISLSNSVSAQPVAGELKLSRKITYEVKAEDEVITKSTPLRYPNVAPEKIDCVGLLNADTPINEEEDGVDGASLTEKLNDLARVIENSIRQRVRQHFHTDIPVSIVLKHSTNMEAELKRKGYKLRISRNFGHEGKQIRGEIWCLDTYKPGDDLGKLTAKVTFGVKASMNSKGKLQIEAIPQVEYKEENVPQDAPRNLVGAIIAKTKIDFENEVKRATSEINRKNLKLKKADIQKFLEGTKSIKKNIPFSFLGGTARLRLTISATLGRIIIDAPGGI